MKNGDREIIYIPMRHLGKRNYYDYIQRKVDSLQQEGFIVSMKVLLIKLIVHSNGTFMIVSSEN
ncbi:hypothetical protein OKW96_14280 [Sphingobacterium sp. KU25419]|nr:hypothetical protein OKW96_14280 [Sphingobacterium sp. KU25419]